jgi:hypothetical protein
MQEEGLPTFIAIMAATVLIIGVMVAAVILGVIMLMPPAVG